jgi:hypothetical protein
MLGLIAKRLQFVVVLARRAYKISGLGVNCCGEQPVIIAGKTIAVGLEP